MCPFDDVIMCSHQVVLTAAMLSIIFKDPHVNEDESEIEEDEEPLDIAPDEDFLHSEEYRGKQAYSRRNIEVNSLRIE